MILHLDMDAFFAQVEQMDRPELRGRPVIIGGLGARGVVSTASYEARAFGVHSAMPMTTARRLCPRGVFLPGSYGRYGELSRRIMDCLGDFSPLVEPASIDEAYVDATGLERLFGPLPEMIAAVKARVAEVTGGLTCSVGAAPVKFLAKICSEVNKPDGVFILMPEDVDAFLCALAVDKIPGVGDRMGESLRGYGIDTIAQARRYPQSFYATRWGKWGLAFYERLYGRGSDAVTPEHVMKSESRECTFDADTLDRAQLVRALMSHAERVGASLRRQGVRGRVVTLKVKYADFRLVTRSLTMDVATDVTQTIFEKGCELLDRLAPAFPVRLIGLGVSGIGQRAVQMLLPGTEGRDGRDPAREEKRRRLDGALDALRGKFGREVVQRGLLFRPGKRKAVPGEDGRRDVDSEREGERRAAPFGE
ncbi:MAG: DNA polymerase IV [Desulfovibrio sp.]|nr:DNA polymerase IV [Desulfovibrio sp.]